MQILALSVTYSSVSVNVMRSAWASAGSSASVGGRDSAYLSTGASQDAKPSAL